MKIEALQAPAGSPPWFMQFLNEQLKPALRLLSVIDAPFVPYTVADIASAPDAASYAKGVAFATDADGLGNSGWIVSDGTSWSAL